MSANYRAADRLLAAIEPADAGGASDETVVGLVAVGRALLAVVDILDDLAIRPVEGS